MNISAQFEKHSSKTKYAFNNKWSPAIADHGFTSIPNILLRGYKSLGITTPELRMIIAIVTFRWEDKNPFPSVGTLANIIGVTKRRARDIITSLHNKDLVKRMSRSYDTNSYSFEPLIRKLDQLAISTKPPGRKQPPSPDKTRLEKRLKSSSKKDPIKNTHLLKPTINTPEEKALDRISKRRDNYSLKDP